MADCLSSKTIEQYVIGRLPREQREAVEQHLECCAVCSGAVESEQLFGELRQMLRASSFHDASVADPLPPDESGNGSAASSIAPGYRVIAELHRGGQGVVYRAIQLATKRTVALKVLEAGTGATERQRRRFEREIDIIASLQHPHIVTIYDSGVSRNHYYFVMEFVAGKPLDEFLAARPPSDPTLREQLRLFRRICSAVAYAHQHGVIHRDLKPRNILVDANGQPCILDFGLAKLSGEQSPGEASFRTHHGEFLGTLAYASPEQAEGDPSKTDVRSDVYALGVILYEMLTGVLPYDVSGSITETLRNIREAEPRRPSLADPRIDHDIETILMKTLAKDRDRRYQSAHELGGDIECYFDGRPLAARRDSTWYVVRKLLRRHRAVVGSAAAFFAVICAALVLSLSFWQRAARDRDLAIAAQKAANEARVEEFKQRQRAEQNRDEAAFQAYVANVAAAGLAIQARDVADAWLQLQRAPPPLRDWEWYHLTGQLNTSLRMFLGHRSYVEQVALFRHRPLALSTSWDKTVRLWNLESGQLEKTWTLDTHAWSAAVSHDDRFFAVGDWAGQVHVYRSEDHQRVLQFDGPTRRVPALAFDPTANVLAAAFGAFDEPVSANCIRLVRVPDGEVLRDVRQQAYVHDLAYRPDGTQLAAAQDQKVVLLDVETGETAGEFAGRATVAFNSEGDRLATGGHAHRAHVFDLDSGQETARLVGHSAPILDVAFTPDDQRLITASRDKSLRLWDLANQRELSAFLGHTWTVTSVAVSPQGSRFVSGSWDRAVLLWDLDNPSAPVRTVSTHDGAVTSLAFTPDQRHYLTSSWDGTVKLCDAWSGACRRTFLGPEQPLQAVCISPDGSRIAAACWDHMVWIWDFDAPRQPRVLRGHLDRVHDVEFLDGERLISGSRDNTLRVWDTSKNTMLEVWHGHDDHVHRVTVAAGGTTVVSAGHTSIRLWNAATGKQERRLARKIIQEDFALAIHPQNNWLVAGASARTLGVWDIGTGHRTMELDAHTDELRCVDFSPGGGRLVSAAFDGTVRLWDIERQASLIALRSGAGQVTCVRFSPDGRFIFGGTDDGQVMIWRADLEAADFTAPVAEHVETSADSQHTVP